MAEVACGFLEFDGTDDEIAVADNAAYDVTAAMSFHLWFRRDYADSVPTLVKRANTITIAINADDRLVVTVSGVTAVTSKLAVPKQVWHAVGIVVYESGTTLNFEFYYKGIPHEVQSVATAAMPAATNTAFYIGSASSASFFNGRMTNFVSTSDRLTASEIATIYASGMLVQDVADYDGDMICLPFNDGSGTTLDNDGLAGVDGTAAGTPVWLNGTGASLQFNPMILKDQGDELYGDILIDKVVWYAPTTTAHLMELTDWAGNDIVRSKCSVAHGEVESWIDMIVRGFKLPDLDSGWVLVYWR